MTRHPTFDAESQPHPRRPTVLVAHRDPVSRDTLEEALQRDDYVTHRAASGRDVADALQAALRRGRHIDLLVVERALLAPRALELLRRSEEAEQPVPCVVIDSEPRTEALDTPSVHAVFEGSFELDDLRTAVVNVLSPPSASLESGVHRRSQWDA